MGWQRTTSALGVLLAGGLMMLPAPAAAQALFTYEPVVEDDQVTLTLTPTDSQTFTRVRIVIDQNGILADNPEGDRINAPMTCDVASGVCTYTAPATVPDCAVFWFRVFDGPAVEDLVENSRDFGVTFYWPYPFQMTGSLGGTADLLKLTITSANRPITTVEADIDDAGFEAMAETDPMVYELAIDPPLTAPATVDLRVTPQCGDPLLRPGITFAPDIPPPASDFDATFDNWRGNNWWVEVDIEANGPITFVGWVPADTPDADPIQMFEQPWGSYAGSGVYIEDCTELFVVVMSDGEEDISETVFWPPGADCEGIPPPAGDFDATFENWRGNNWWVEVDIDATAPISFVGWVPADTPDADPIQMFEQPWGSYAGSGVYIEDCTELFVVVMSGSDQDVSETVFWPPDADCDGGIPPPAGDFDATFDNWRGNNWWVEVDIDATAPISFVGWIPADNPSAGPYEMVEQPWGSYAGSGVYVEDCTELFVVVMSGSDQDVSETITWPPDADCDGGIPPPAGDFDATFDNWRGNNWWVEVDIDATAPISFVGWVPAATPDAEPHPMVKQPWGSYAGSGVYIPDCTRIYVVVLSNGASDTSAVRFWPPDAACD